MGPISSSEAEIMLRYSLLEAQGPGLHTPGSTLGDSSLFDKGNS